MNKPELITEISNRTGFTKKNAEIVVSAFIDTVKDALMHGDKISIVGFGTFEVTERAGRVGRNPRTGETIQIAASKTPKFKVAKTFKEFINDSK